MTAQLHAAVVELSAGARATIKYSTVQNWYAGDEEGVGGIYNFVTKRGLCHGENAHISWTQVGPRFARLREGIREGSRDVPVVTLGVPCFANVLEVGSV